MTKTMSISFNVDPDDLDTIRLAHSRYSESDEDPVEIGELLREAANEADSLKWALRNIVKAVDADPATYPTTTLKMIRDIAVKALEGEEMR